MEGVAGGIMEKRGKRKIHLPIGLTSRW